MTFQLYKFKESNHMEECFFQSSHHFLIISCTQKFPPKKNLLPIGSSQRRTISIDSLGASQLVTSWTWWLTGVGGSSPTPLTTNMTLENPHFQ